MNWDILHKYKQGNCSEQELKQLGVWLKENPANEDFFQTFIESDNLEPGEPDFAVDAQEAWKAFKSTYGIPASSEATKRDVFDRKSYTDSRQGRKYWYSLAAAVVISFIALMVTIPQWETRDASPKEREAFQTIATAKGQRTHLELGDGTQIILNAESVLKIPENYGEGSRTLYLDGEAFFDVPHDEANPFLVITAQGYVKDLGTQFNVMAYDSTKLEVAVKEGLVSMGSVRKGIPQKKLVKLTPHKLGVLKKEGGLTVSNIEDITVYTGWAQGKLVFKQTPLSEVIRRLERWYDIKCAVRNPELYQRTLTATYSEMPLNEVLEVVAATMRLSYERTGEKIIFSDCNS